jgi:hypothetical protein
MKIRLVLLGLVAFCLGTLAARADTYTYRYAGAPMISAPGAIGGSENCSTCSIDGSLVIDNPLIATSNSLVASEQIIPVSYSFTATGLGTFTQNNSTFSMFAAVEPSLNIYAFYFEIGGSPGSISSDFYGSGFEFTDYYNGPGPSPSVNVYAEGNYNLSIWSYTEQAPEPSAGLMVLIAVIFLAIFERACTFRKQV